MSIHDLALGIGYIHLGVAGVVLMALMFGIIYSMGSVVWRGMMSKAKKDNDE